MKQRPIAWLIVGCTLAMVASCQHNPVKPAARPVNVTVNFVNNCPDNVKPDASSTCPAALGADFVCVYPEAESDKIEVNWLNGTGMTASDDFKITRSAGACATDHPKKCKIKKKRDYNLGDAWGVLFKYSVVATAKDCKLDPFIILMNQ